MSDNQTQVPENQVQTSEKEIETKQKKKKSVFEIILWITLSLIILLSTTLIILNRVVFFSVYVDGPSMSPTLKNGDVLFVSKDFEVKEGDIIVIDGEKKKPNGEGYDWLIKRAILIGEKNVVKVVEIRDGKVFVGYKNQILLELQEDYLPSDTITEPDSSNKGLNNQPISRWEIGEGEIFYLGDNRGESADSRSKYGTCKISQVRGTVGDFAHSFRWLSGFMYDTSQFFSNLFGG